MILCAMNLINLFKNNQRRCLPSAMFKISENLYSVTALHVICANDFDRCQLKKLPYVCMQPITVHSCQCDISKLLYEVMLIIKNLKIPRKKVKIIHKITLK